MELKSAGGKGNRRVFLFVKYLKSTCASVAILEVEPFPPLPQPVAYTGGVQILQLRAVQRRDRRCLPLHKSDIVRIIFLVEQVVNVIKEAINLSRFKIEFQQNIIK